jgi:hypothetical protein
LARLSVIRAFNSASFSFFSSSVSGLIYTAGRINKSIEIMIQPRHAHLLSRFFELIVTTLLRMKVREGGISEYLSAFTTLYALTGSQRQVRDQREARISSKVNRFRSTHLCFLLGLSRTRATGTTSINRSQRLEVLILADRICSTLWQPRRTRRGRRGRGIGYRIPFILE